MWKGFANRINQFVDEIVPLEEDNREGGGQVGHSALTSQPPQQPPALSHREHDRMMMPPHGSPAAPPATGEPFALHSKNAPAPAVAAQEAGKRAVAKLSAFFSAVVKDEEDEEVEEEEEEEGEDEEEHVDNLQPLPLGQYQPMYNPPLPPTPSPPIREEVPPNVHERLIGRMPIKRAPVAVAVTPPESDASAHGNPSGPSSGWTDDDDADEDGFEPIVPMKHKSVLQQQPQSSHPSPPQPQQQQQQQTTIPSSVRPLQEGNSASTPSLSTPSPATTVTAHTSLSASPAELDTVEGMNTAPIMTDAVPAYHSGSPRTQTEALPHGTRSSTDLSVQTVGKYPETLPPPPTTSTASISPLSISATENAVLDGIQSPVNNTSMVLAPTSLEGENEEERGGVEEPMASNEAECEAPQHVLDGMNSKTSLRLSNIERVAHPSATNEPITTPTLLDEQKEKNNEEAEAEAAGRQRLLEEKISLESRVDQLQNEMEVVRAESMAHAAQTTERHEQAIATLQRQAAAECDALRHQLESSQRQLREAMDQRATTLPQETTHDGGTDDEKDHLKELLIAKEKEIQALTLAHEQAETEMKSLRRSLEESAKQVEGERAQQMAAAEQQGKHREEELLARYHEAERVHQEEVHRIQSRLEQAELGIAEWKRQVFEKDEELEAANAEKEACEAALDSANQTIKALQAQLKERVDGGTSAQKKTEQQLEKYAELHANMTQQIEEYEKQMENIENCLSDAVQNAGVVPPEEEEFSTLLEFVEYCAKELVQLGSMTRNASVVQTEWERTYQQAKSVNQSLQQQVGEAWRTIGTLREAVSLKEESEKELVSQVKEGQRRCEHLQAELAKVIQELEAVRDRQAMSEISAEQSSEQANEVAALQSQVEQLHLMLHTREDELLSAQMSADNLQHALESFKARRDEDIAAQTMHFQAEINELRQRVDSVGEMEAKHEAAMAALRQEHEREVADKYQELRSLHNKLAELRRKMQEGVHGNPNSAGLPPLSDGRNGNPQNNTQDLVDKQLLAQVFANFIHAFVEQRRETPEILKLLCGLLDWDEAMQEKVGLLPGPSNPQPPMNAQRQRGGGGGGAAVAAAAGGAGRLGKGLISGWRQRLSVGRQKSQPAPGTAATPGLTGEEGGAQKRQGSLAALWVDFLMKESEGLEKEGGASQIYDISNNNTKNMAELESENHGIDRQELLQGATPLRMPPPSAGGASISSPSEAASYTPGFRGDSPMPRPIINS